ncbi:hypothetical protein HQS1_58080 [Delftia lacustris]|nr:hypothetical protein HQS1_58080 [Delftia lacustris]
MWMALERTDTGATSAVAACTASGFFAPDLSLLAFLAMGSLSTSYGWNMPRADRPETESNDNASAVALEARPAQRCSHQDRRLTPGKAQA